MKAKNSKRDHQLEQEIVRREQLEHMWGVCDKTLRKWEGDGLPHIRVSSRLTLYPIQAAREWMDRRVRKIVTTAKTNGGAA